MPSRKSLAVVTLLFAVAGCGLGGPHGVEGKSASFGSFSKLEAYHVIAGSEESIPVCYVLFVPQWDPRVNARFHHSSGGDERHHTFSIGYEEQGVPQFENRSVSVTRRFLLPDTFEGGGRRFDLDDGNIFVVAVARDGALNVSQVPRVQETWQPAMILAAVKDALPNDARVQALTFSRS